MLRQRKNMLQKRKNTVMIERKEKQNVGSECSPWQTPPEDIMEMILQFVDFADQRRLGQVSKSWRSIIFQTFMRSARRQLPWLILPEVQNCRTNKYLSFLTFPENKLSTGKAVKLKLPKQLKGGWIYGSSKGWLIIIKEKGLNSEMYLVNPISRAVHKLPPLRTIPSFKNFLKTRKWELLGANGFCLRVKMSTSDGFNSSSNFTVAAYFEDQKTLGLCRPGDQKWSVFPVLDGNQDDCLCDILFSSGRLYALVGSKKIDGSVAPTRALNFAFQDAEHLKLTLVYDKHEDYNDIPPYLTDYTPWLLESTNKEVLLIHQMHGDVLKTKNDGDEQINEINDGDHGLNNEGDEEDIGSVEGNNDDEGGGGGRDGDDDEVVNKNIRNVCHCSFRTYNIDQYNNNFYMIQSLGDQSLFLGNDGAFSLPASNIKELENNCIYFAMNMCHEVELEWLPKTYISDDFGIFYFDGQRTERPFQGMEISVKYQPSWFTPTL
ncbi:uncharacterized protein LOC133735881 isoform X1 [Rosa rugosa]|uniref:uncharacterized protein LOC133735881 isoform X1 n=1 Tax=Rosa rugosa TaxID=74645 RepID=UPI002B40EA37|nr:uncharacterized protein LOC133735881 isoform X1 [Rosa rugosa]XP_062019302.1 uncharacterized protein LOC133735881 isoform X1 [Rosa rugosa]XP_062019303.1 uncharacterized protein LOC133735881 isoform X1 [Rosa rugosa]XP_062019304.1 uncharacterized protein LOC133735881 isoform X1 [Rosa rugosa]XP_062019305.1 uncharacterized protein LOC133735881 isoform X1 [Rosa rugosa]XP_062019306.1 uncharacterized protein LOC133735881 isoform X1 [Rosa rugosa]XP_062019307.1 uncharacterized protein LOC133735881 i